MNIPKKSEVGPMVTEEVLETTLAASAIIGAVMAVAKGVGATKLASDETQESLEGMAALMNTIYHHAQNVKGTPLTVLSKRTTISSMTYIEDSLVNEEITLPVMANVNYLLTAYVICALGILNITKSFKEVEAVLGQVTNEDMTPEFKSAVNMVSEYVKGTVTEEAATSSIDEAAKTLGVGRVIEFDFNIGGADEKGKGGTLRVPVGIKLIPKAAPTDTIMTIFKLNFKTLLSRRWRMTKAGELRFWRDFVLGLDLANMEGRAIARDRNNVLAAFLANKSKRKRKHYLKVLKGGSGNPASSIIVVEKKTLEDASDQNHIDFDDFKQRQTFFDQSLALMLVVVDPMYEMVDVYYNGLEEYSELPYSSIKKVGGDKGSGMDLKVLMEAVARGAAPKY